jgi:hypothetical protein
MIVNITIRLFVEGIGLDEDVGGITIGGRLFKLVIKSVTFRRLSFIST